MPLNADPYFWTCPFGEGRDLRYRDGGYRLGSSKLLECANPICKQFVSESALSAASAKRRLMAAQSAAGQR